MEIFIYLLILKQVDQAGLELTVKNDLELWIILPPKWWAHGWTTMLSLFITRAQTQGLLW